MTKLYESHITIEPVFDEQLELFSNISTKYNFKPAKLFMQKQRADTPERSSRDTFCTGHSDTYEDMEDRMLKLVESLIHNGFKVWRYKIEHILLDVRL